MSIILTIGSDIIVYINYINNYMYISFITLPGLEQIDIDGSDFFSVVKGEEGL